MNAQNISKRFGATPLFEGLTFQVDEGGRIGLIGPNGAGKSTLLAMLGGEAETDTGEIAIRKRAKVGYVRQISEYEPGSTVRGVLEAAMARARVGDNEREQRLRETLGRAGFADDGADTSIRMDAEAAALSRLSLVEPSSG